MVIGTSYSVCDICSSVKKNNRLKICTCCREKKACNACGYCGLQCCPIDDLSNVLQLYNNLCKSIACLLIEKLEKTDNILYKQRAMILKDIYCKM